MKICFVFNALLILLFSSGNSNSPTALWHCAGCRSQSGSERGGAASFWHTGDAADRYGSSDGSAAGQNAGRDGHRCSELLQPFSGQPHEVRRTGEEKEAAVAGEEGGGEREGEVCIN